jgi:hypothetical protein
MRLTWEVSGGDRHLNFHGDRDNLNTRAVHQGKQDL